MGSPRADKQGSDNDDWSHFEEWSDSQARKHALKCGLVIFIYMADDIRKGFGGSKSFASGFLHLCTPSRFDLIWI